MLYISSIELKMSVMDVRSFELTYYKEESKIRPPFNLTIDVSHSREFIVFNS